jgi:predicted Rossmann fold nucleotide-binding protein DprA/Smf involved in DNA uptake
LLKQPGVTMVTAPADILEVLAPMRGRRHMGAAAIALGEAAAARRGLEVPLPQEERRSPAPPAALPDQPAGPANAAEALLAVLGPAPSTLDEAARAAGVTAKAARVAALELALAGLVEMHGGQLISLRPR